MIPPRRSWDCVAPNSRSSSAVRSGSPPRAGRRTLRGTRRNSGRGTYLGSTPVRPSRSRRSVPPHASPVRTARWDLVHLVFRHNAERSPEDEREFVEVLVSVWRGTHRLRSESRFDAGVSVPGLRTPNPDADLHASRSGLQRNQGRAPKLSTRRVVVRPASTVPQRGIGIVVPPSESCLVVMGRLPVRCLAVLSLRPRRIVLERKYLRTVRSSLAYTRHRLARYVFKPALKPSVAGTAS